MNVHARHYFLPALLFAVSMGIAPLSHAIFAVTEPWVRADPNGRTAEVFMKLRSSDAVTLAGVDSFAARSVSIRSAGGKPATATLMLPPNVVVELKPDATRIELNGLVRRLKRGEHVPVTLIIRDANGREQKHFINAEVRGRSPTEDEARPHGPPGHKH